MRFEDYVAEQGQALLRLAYVLTGDPHRAEDLTQTTLTDCFRQWRRVDAARHPHAYVRRALVNAHLDWHRRRSSTEVPIDLASLSRGMEATGAGVGDDFAAREHLRALLSGLAPRARTVLVLRYYVDLDDRGIAEILGISESTVRATVSRALTSLRDGLAGHESAVAQWEETP